MCCFFLSKSENIWSFRVNCNRYLIDVHLKHFLLIKSFCLLTQLFHHPEDNGNTSWHPPLSHSIVLIPLIVLITRNFITKFNVLVFQFHGANRDLSLKLVSPLVCRGPWISTVVLYCWCHSDSASVLLYFTVQCHVKAFALSMYCVNKTVLLAKDLGRIYVLKCPAKQWKNGIAAL